MDTNEIVAQIDAEIARLQEVQNILSGTTSTPAKRAYKKPSARPTLTMPGQRVISPAARARIVAAQKVRWAKYRKAKKVENNTPK